MFIVVSFLLTQDMSMNNKFMRVLFIMLSANYWDGREAHAERFLEILHHMPGK